MAADRRAARQALGVLACALLSLAAAPVWADEAGPPPAVGQEQPAGAATSALTAPSMAGPLTANPDPAKFDADPLGTVFLTGAPSDDWSIQAGKLSSLSGVEANFTFQNMNIERGLLWGQTANVSRGLQVNH